MILYKSVTYKTKAKKNYTAKYRVTTWWLFMCIPIVVINDCIGNNY